MIRKFCSIYLYFFIIVYQAIILLGLSNQAVADISPPTLPPPPSSLVIPSLDADSIPPLIPPSKPIGPKEVQNTQPTAIAINPTQAKIENKKLSQNNSKTPTSNDSTKNFIGDNIVWFGVLDGDGVATLTANLLCLYYNYDHRNSEKRCYVKQEASDKELVARLVDSYYKFIIIPTDIQAEALNGVGRFKDHGKATTIRQVLPLYDESLVLLTATNSGIKTIESLQNKKLHIIGNEPQKTRNLLVEVLKQYRMSYSSFKDITEEAIPNINAICDNNIDGAIFINTNPNSEIEKMTRWCEINIINLEDSTIKNITSTMNQYKPSIIPKGTYLGNTSDIQTLAVTKSIISTSNVDNFIVENMVKSIAKHIKTLQESQPTLVDFSTNNNATSSSNILPLHGGMVQYLTTSPTS